MICSYSSPQCLDMLRLNYYEKFAMLVLLIISISLLLLLWAYYYVTNYLDERIGKDGDSTFWDEFQGNYLGNEFIFILLVYPMSSGEGKKSYLHYFNL